MRRPNRGRTRADTEAAKPTDPAHPANPPMNLPPRPVKGSLFLVPLDPSDVLADWPALFGGQVRRLGMGLINDTFVVRSSAGRHVLQRVNPIFGPEVHADIQAVTLRLEGSGMVTPRLVPTRDGGLCRVGDGELWRVLTWIDGVTHNRVLDGEQARAAGWLLARFHSVLSGLDYEFQSVRIGVHDTRAHLQRLEGALEMHPAHRLRDVVAPLAAEILAAARDLPAVDSLPARVVHGDPKLNNILFEATDPHRAVCMVDLDTCGRMGLHLEVGDAWRSWCNPVGEDADEAEFDMGAFRASWAGYRAGCTLDLSAREGVALIHGVEWITLELSARFLADSLREDYFGWDPTRYPAAGEHNLVRARGQWALHRAVVGCRAERTRVLEP